MRNNRLLSIALGIAVLCILVLTQITSAPTVLANSKSTQVIIWSQKRVSAVVAPEATFTTNVIFTTTVDLQNVTLKLTPSLQGVVTVTPATLPSVTKSLPNMVQIVVVIPTNTKRKSFNGTLKIQAGGRTFAKPLSLKFKVGKSIPLTVQDFKFTPSTITIHRHQTVTWTNLGPSQHTTTSDNAIWGSDALNPGSMFSQTFNSVGIFNYHCSIHPSMHGTVIVTP